MVSFAKEKQDLMVKIISFDIIYAIRIALGYTLIPPLYSGVYGPFWTIEGSLITTTLLDLTPPVIVMLMHRRNFRRLPTINMSYDYNS